MPSLRDIRRKIKSINGLKQITKAMKLISYTRLQKAQAAILNSRVYADAIKEVAGCISTYLKLENIESIYFKSSGKKLYVVFGSDKGLCGAYNLNILRNVINLEGDFFLCGRKLLQIFSKLNKNVVREYPAIMSKPDFLNARIVADDVISYFKLHIPEVIFVYSKFLSIVKSEVVFDRVLPFQFENTYEYIFEDEPVEVFTELIPKYILSCVWRAMLEAYSSELSARYIAMDNATKNATDYIDELRLLANKKRQEMITKELIEISNVI